MGNNPTAIGVIPNLSTFHPQIIHRYIALSPAPSDENAVKRHVSSHCPPRGAPMPFGTSTKERLCTEMNNYPQNANIRHHFLVICKRIHKPRRGWTTSVDNPVDSVDNLRSYAVCQGKIGKNTVDNPVETVDAFAQFETI